MQASLSIMSETNWKYVAVVDSVGIIFHATLSQLISWMSSPALHIFRYFPEPSNRFKQNHVNWGNIIASFRSLVLPWLVVLQSCIQWIILTVQNGRSCCSASRGRRWILTISLHVLVTWCWTRLISTGWLGLWFIKVGRFSHGFPWFQWFPKKNNDIKPHHLVMLALQSMRFRDPWDAGPVQLPAGSSSCRRLGGCLAASRRRAQEPLDDAAFRSCLRWHWSFGHFFCGSTWFNTFKKWV